MAKSKVTVGEAARKMRERVLPGLLQNSLNEVNPSWDALFLAAEFGYRAGERGDSIQLMTSNLRTLYVENTKDGAGFFPEHFYVIEDDGRQQVWKRSASGTWLRPGSDTNVLTVDRVIGEVDLATGKVIPMEKEPDEEDDPRYRPRFLLKNKKGFYVYNGKIGSGRQHRITWETTRLRSKALYFTRAGAKEWQKRINNAIPHNADFFSIIDTSDD
jgi:hypothetical protein